MKHVEKQTSYSGMKQSLLPILHGGLDIRDLALYNIALLKKISLEILTGESFFMRILRARFFDSRLTSTKKTSFSYIFFPGICPLFLDLM